MHLKGWKRQRLPEICPLNTRQDIVQISSIRVAQRRKEERPFRLQSGKSEQTAGRSAPAEKKEAPALSGDYILDYSLVGNRISSS